MARRRHVEKTVMAKGGRKGETRRWCKKGYGVTVGEPSGDSADHVGSRCTPVHPEKEKAEDDGPSQGALRLTWCSRRRRAKAESVHHACGFIEECAEKSEKWRDASSSKLSIV